MRTGLKTIAIGLGDCHFSHDPPLARAETRKEWYRSQIEVIEQITKLQDECNNAPILIAGDIFDQWNSPPELINMVIKHLPRRVFAIPGNHDLPNHDFDARHRSSYGTLIESGKVKEIDLNGEQLVPILGIHSRVHGVSCRQELPDISKVPTPDDLPELRIAVIHDYCWNERSSESHYPGAPTNKTLANWNTILNQRGYVCGLFGDNHKYCYSTKTPNLMNCGTLMRRTVTDDPNPKIARLLENGKWCPVYMDTTNDKLDAQTDFLAAAAYESFGVEMATFIETINNLKEITFHFNEAIDRFLGKNEIRKRNPELYDKIIEFISIKAKVTDDDE